MKLSEAIQKQADIICSNEVEKSTVINILHLNGVKPWRVLDGLNVLLYYNAEYQIANYVSNITPIITAATFIAANTPEETTNQNEPTPHSSNVI